MMAGAQEMVWLTCPVCGIQYGAPKSFIDARREERNQGTSKSWYCPNGHTLSYHETELDRVRRERDRLTQENARLEDERRAADRRTTEERKKRERVEKRVAAGVCPCCNRTVSQLARHMQTKHPDVPFVPAARPAPKRRTARAS